MKRDDFSHAEPVIYIQKDYITALAFTLKNKYGTNYMTALNIVGNCLCGTHLNFNDFHHEHRYDLTYEQAKLAFPDIIDLYCDRLQKATGLNKPYVLTVLNTPAASLIKNNMASLYEAETGLLACEKQVGFSEIVDERKRDKESLIKICNELEASLQNETLWIEQNKQDIFIEIKDMIAKLRKGKIANRQHQRVIKWCKDQIQITLNHP